MPRMTRLALLASLVTALSACADDPAPAPAEPGPAPAVLSAETLEDRLPPSVGPLDREATATDAQKALGAEVVSATARYSSPEGGAVNLTITDLGTAEMVEMMGYGWGLAGATPPDRLGDYPAEVGAGGVRVLVAERFLVEAEGSVDWAEDAVEAVDLDALAEAAGR